MAFEGIRWAIPEDEDSIYSMLMKLHEENGVFPVSEPKVRAFIRTATGRNGGLIGVVQGTQGMEGSVGLELGQWWYTDEWSLSEKWNFVLPEYRKSTHAKKLIEWAKWAADVIGVPLQMGIISTKRTQAKVRLYDRQMQNVGAMFMYNLPATKLDIN